MELSFKNETDQKVKLTNLDDIHDTNEMYHMEMEGSKFKNLSHG
jgi:hypothetical protein